MFIVASFDATPRGKVPMEEDTWFGFLRDLREAAPAGFDGPMPTFTLFYNTSLLTLRKSWRPRAGTKWADADPSVWQPLLASKALRPSSAVGYAVDPDAIDRSVEAIKGLGAAGVELASHSVRHLRGTGWTFAEWTAEFAEHQRILDMHGLPKPMGFRAPFLASSKPGRARATDAMFHVMQEFGMRYDTSKVLPAARWPKRVGPTGIWEVSLPMYERESGRKILLFGHSGLNHWAFIRVARSQFERRYYGNRAPLALAGHGEHIQQVKELLMDACYRPGVRCGTYSELMDYMECHPELEGYAGP